MPPSIRADFAVLAAAYLVISSQIACVQVLQIVFGQTGFNECAILASLMFGIAWGESSYRNAWIEKYLSLPLSLLVLPAAIFFDDLLILSIKNRGGVFAVLAAAIFLSVYAGVVLARTLYNRSDLARNYLKLNLANLGCLALFLLAVNYWGYPGALGILGGASLFLVHEKSQNKDHNSYLPRRNLNLVTGFFGVLSAAFVAIFFQVQSLVVYPTGYDFYVYLAFVFFFLAAAPLLNRKLLLGGVQAVGLGNALCLILLFSISAARPDGKFIFPLHLLSFDSAFLEGSYVLVAAIFSLILFSPYFFYALLLPVRAKEAPADNHLFSLALGNAAGFLGFAFLIYEWGLSVGIFVFLVFSVIIGVSMIPRGRVLFVLLASLFVWAFPWAELDRILVAQGNSFQRIHDWVYFRPRAQYPVDSAEKIEAVSRRAGTVGYIVNFGVNMQGLGLGGYVSPMNQVYDILRAHVARHLFAPGKRVLILGLGNQQILSRLSGAGGSIDVVDNFAPYNSQEFLDKISAVNFSSWDREIKFIHMDALNFLARNADSYDLIVWNLAWPNYATATKLFTKEFFGMIRGALAQDGIFVMEHFDNTLLDCLLVETFRFSYMFPAARSRGSLVLGTKAEHGEYPPNRLTNAACGELAIATLSKPYLPKIQARFGFFKNRYQTPEEFAKPKNFIESMSLLTAKIGRPILLFSDSPAARAKLMQAAAPHLKEKNSYIVDFGENGILKENPKLTLREISVALQHHPDAKLIASVSAGFDRGLLTCIAKDRLLIIGAKNE